jgi:hypothetical protein
MYRTDSLRYQLHEWAGTAYFMYSNIAYAMRYKFDIFSLTLCFHVGSAKRDNTIDWLAQTGILWVFARNRYNPEDAANTGSECMFILHNDPSAGRNDTLIYSASTGNCVLRYDVVSGDMPLGTTTID